MTHARGCGANCRCDFDPPTRACGVCNCGAQERARVGSIAAAWRRVQFLAPPDQPADDQEDQQL